MCVRPVRDFVRSPSHLLSKITYEGGGRESKNEMRAVYKAVRRGEGKKNIFAKNILYKLFSSNTIKGTIIVCSVRSVSFVCLSPPQL